MKVNQRKKVETKVAETIKPKVRTNLEVKASKPETIITKDSESTFDETETPNKILSDYKPLQKYVVMRVNCTDEVRKDIIARVNAGELKYSHYCVDNNKGEYHYCIINKTVKK